MTEDLIAAWEAFIHSARDLKDTNGQLQKQAVQLGETVERQLLQTDVDPHSISVDNLRALIQVYQRLDEALHQGGLDDLQAQLEQQTETHAQLRAHISESYNELSKLNLFLELSDSFVDQFQNAAAVRRLLVLLSVVEILTNQAERIRLRQELQDELALLTASESELEAKLTQYLHKLRDICAQHLTDWKRNGQDHLRQLRDAVNDEVHFVTLISLHRTVLQRRAEEVRSEATQVMQTRKQFEVEYQTAQAEWEAITQRLAEAQRASAPDQIATWVAQLVPLLGSTVLTNMTDPQELKATLQAELDYLRQVQRMFEREDQERRLRLQVAKANAP